MHSCSLENLKVAPYSVNLGALFGAFNATGNCKFHLACVSEQCRLLLCWPYEILHSSQYILYLHDLTLSCILFLFFPCSLCFNSEDHMKVEYITFKNCKNLYSKRYS
jgi:hypothetical protein